MFKQPEQAELPPHRTHDHMIPLKEGKEPACKRTYLMSEKELQALCEYVTDQLWKGNIWPSKSLAGHEVLFMLKKDGRL